MQQVNQWEEAQRTARQAAPAAGLPEEGPAGTQPPKEKETAKNGAGREGGPPENAALPGTPPEKEARPAQPGQAPGTAEEPWARLRNALVDRLVNTAWWKLLAEAGCTVLAIRLFVESDTVEEMFQTIVRICGGFITPVLDFLEQLWLGFGQAVQQRWLVGVALGVFLLYLALREIRASHTTGRALLRIALLAGGTVALLYWSAQGGMEMLALSGISGLLALVLAVALCVCMGLGVLYVVSEQLQGQRPLARLKQNTVDRAVRHLDRQEETGGSFAGRGLLLGALSAVLSGAVLVFGLLHFGRAIAAGQFSGVYQVLESTELYALLALAMLFPVIGTLAWAVSRWKKKPGSIGAFSLCTTLELLFVQAALSGPQGLLVHVGGPAVSGIANLLLFCAMLLAVHWLTWLTLQLISAAPVEFHISSIHVGMSNPVAVVLTAAVSGARLLFNGVTELLYGLWMVLVAGDDLGFGEPASAPRREPAPPNHLPKWKDRLQKNGGGAAAAGAEAEKPSPARRPAGSPADGETRPEENAPPAPSPRPEEPRREPTVPKLERPSPRADMPSTDLPDSPAPPLSREELEAMRAELAARKLHERYNKP